MKVGSTLHWTQRGRRSARITYTPAFCSFHLASLRANKKWPSITRCLLVPAESLSIGANFSKKRGGERDELKKSPIQYGTIFLVSQSCFEAKRGNKRSASIRCQDAYLVALAFLSARMTAGRPLARDKALVWPEAPLDKLAHDGKRAPCIVSHCSLAGKRGQQLTRYEEQCPRAKLAGHKCNRLLRPTCTTTALPTTTATIWDAPNQPFTLLPG